jgi:hypothetical protein
MNMKIYHPDYIPHDGKRFTEMFNFLIKSSDLKDFSARTLLFIFDKSYSREDIVVAQKRAALQLGYENV